MLDTTDNLVQVSWVTSVIALMFGWPWDFPGLFTQITKWQSSNGAKVTLQPFPKFARLMPSEQL